MDILFLLIPLSVLLALSVMGVLALAVWSCQFEELGSESQRILLTDPAESAKAIDTNLIHINTPNAVSKQTHL